MNIERCLILADHIEKCEHYAGSVPRNAGTTTFQMNRYRFQCGSPACIGGHACTLFDVDRLYTNDSLFETARRVLSLTHEDAQMLFEPFVALPFIERTEILGKISPKMAADTIRDFVKTGIVVWTQTIERRSAKT